MENVGGALIYDRGEIQVPEVPDKAPAVPTKSEVPHQLKKDIAVARIRMGYSQKVLADLIQVKQTHMKDFETGKARPNAQKL